MKRYILLAILLFAGFAARAHAQILTASDCTQTAVQTQFSAVTNSTTTIRIPAGVPSHCIWGASGTGLTLNVPSGSGGLSVIFAGTCTGSGDTNTLSCNDATSVADAMPNVNTAGDHPVLSINVPAGVKFSMQGLTITGTGVSPVQTFQGGILISGSSQSIILTQNHIENINQVSLGLLGCTAGVAYNNIISQSQASIIFRTQCATTNDWAGQNPWAQPTNLGTQNQWDFEKNELIGGSTDCDKGGRFTVRYNTFTAGRGTAQWLLTHPTGEPGGAIRGCRAWEAYGNNFIIPPGSGNGDNGNVFSLWFLSSGVGVMWNNRITLQGSGTSLSYMFALISERSTNTTYSQTPTPNGWGYCGTHQTGTGSSWDQNSDSVSGRQCMDNPGMGQGDQITASATASFPTIVNTTTGTIAWIHQQLEGIYEWGDITGPGAPYNFVDNAQYSGISPMPIQANNNYYLWCNSAATTGCTNFTGATGVGSGPLASRPATCTTGVGYFATDQGSWNHSGTGGQGLLYKCTSTNTWSLYYTPLQYPNVLTNGNFLSWTPVIAPSGGGTITGPNAAQGNYAQGTIVGPLTAVPATNYVFANWSGATGSASPVCTGTANPLPSSFSLTQNSSCTANFTFVGPPPAAATPTFSPTSPYTGNSVNVSIASTTPSATIKYCSSNSGTCTPTISYATPLSFGSSGPTNICAFATATGYSQSATACWAGTYQASSCGNPTQMGPNYSGNYLIGGSSTFTLPLAVGFSSPTPGCSMVYTELVNPCSAGGCQSPPVPDCATSLPYPMGGFSLSQSTAIRVVACNTAGGFAPSATEGGTWSIVQLIAPTSVNATILNTTVQ